jgi:hypothetical protein
MITGYSGSPARYLLGALRNRQLRPFLVKHGSIKLPDSLQYNYSLEKSRSNFGLSEKDAYSYGYEVSPSNIIDVVKPLLRDNRLEILRILGSDFLVNNIRFWRNLSLPNSEHLIDHYSNVFHQDTVIDQNLIQILVLLSDVGDDDGPFEWYEKDHHSKVHKYFKCRSDICKHQDQISSLPSPHRLIGKRGSYLLINTGYHYHRDSIPMPAKDRVIMSIGLFPKYANIGMSSAMLL